MSDLEQQKRKYLEFLTDSEFTDQRELEQHVKSLKPGADELYFDREQPFTSTVPMEQLDEELHRINPNLKTAAELHLMSQFRINTRRPTDPSISKKRKRKILQLAHKIRNTKKGGRKLKRRKMKKTKKYRNKK